MSFTLLLVILLLLSGLIFIFDKIGLWSKLFSKCACLTYSKYNKPWWIDYAHSFFPVIAIILIIRSFIVQPWHVPTGSLEPTLLPGDYIMVNQFAYGLRLPISNTKIISIGLPKTGDLAVFRSPEDPSLNYIKRVIGTPGDHILYKNKQLTINGKTVQQVVIGKGIDVERPEISYLIEKLEYLGERTHKILLNPLAKDLKDEFEVIVPPAHYFVMGDNRDASSDSRIWGFVPEENLVGKPFALLLSWDPHEQQLRKDRFIQDIG